MTTPWSSKSVPTAAPVAPGLVGPSKAMVGVAALCAVAVAGAGYLAFTYDRGSEGDNNASAAVSQVEPDDSGDEKSLTDPDKLNDTSEGTLTADTSLDSKDQSDGQALSGDTSSNGSSGDDVDAGQTAQATNSDGEAADTTNSDATNSGSEKSDSEKSDSEKSDSDSDSPAADSDTGATKDESAAAVSPHEPQDDINDTARRAIFSRGMLFLRGEVPTQEAADTIVAKAIAVMGEDRVVVQYTINPSAELTGSAPFIVEDVVLFESGSNVINPQFEPILNFGIALLRQNERVVITVVGHTDSHGSTLANEQLAHARTAMVAQYWLDRGVPATQIEAVIKGESEPIADNSTPEGAQANRRVEFIISGILLD